METCGPIPGGLTLSHTYVNLSAICNACYCLVQGAWCDLQLTALLAACYPPNCSFKGAAQFFVDLVVYILVAPTPFLIHQICTGGAQHRGDAFFEGTLFRVGLSAVLGGQHGWTGQGA